MRELSVDSKGWPDGIDHRKTTKYQPQQPPPQQVQQPPRGKFHAAAGEPTELMKPPFASEGFVLVGISSPDLGMAASEIVKAWHTTRDIVPNPLALLRMDSFKGQKTLTACIYLGEQYGGMREVHAGLRGAEMAMNSLCNKLIEAGFIACLHEEFSAS